MKCTPDETGRCTTCGDMLSVPKKATDADRIAQLTAEHIDNLNSALAQTRCERDEAEEKLAAERAAHERTKAEFEAAKADLADARSIADTRGRERFAAQAEAAAMRDALDSLVTCEENEEGSALAHHLANARDAITGTAGRALAARVPLWRRAVDILRRCEMSAPLQEEADDLVAKLAALDEKGGDNG